MKQYKTVEILRPFERNGSFPLDATSVFLSYDSAVRYAHDDKSAYPGQIISVIDEEHEKTAIYKLDYDKDKVYRLILQPITVGAASSSGGSFDLLGIVETASELPNIKDNGDMYLVKDENIFYVAIETSEDVVEWQPLNLQVDLVTELRDGIFKHEIYSTLINRSSAYGVYFSSGDGNPENNRWLEVEATTVEQERGNFTMLSVGRVKQIVSTMTNTSKPHIEIISETPTENYVLTTIRPVMNIVYYPELGGKLHKLTVLKDDSEIVLETYPEDKDLVVGENGKSYSYSYDADFISSEIRQTITYKVIAEYEQSEDGNMPAGRCENIINFNFYQPITYGTNLETHSTFMKDGTNVLELEYHPEKFNELTDTIQLTIPVSHYLKDVTFVNQNDLFARSLFDDGVASGDFKVYSYHVLIGFKSPGKFIFYISEDDQASEQ